MYRGDIWQTRRLAIGLHALGGAIAGAVIIGAIENYNSIIPAALCALFGLGGAAFGIFAGAGIRLQLPAFGWTDVVRHAVLAGAGFAGGYLIAFANPSRIGVGVLILPIIIGALMGSFARRWIAKAGNFPSKRAKLGWAWGALIFMPSYLLLGLVLSLFVQSTFGNNYLFGEFSTLISVSAGALAGALGGWMSGWITVKNIVSGLGYRAERATLKQKQQVLAAAIRDDNNPPAQLGTLVQQQATPIDTLQVVDEDNDAALKQKAKARVLDIPLPETPRQWRMVLGVGVLVFAVAAIFFSLFPTRVVEVLVTPTYPPPTEVLYPTGLNDFYLNFDWATPFIAMGSLTPLPPSVGVITRGTPVYILQSHQTQFGDLLYTVEDRNGNFAHGWIWQIEPTYFPIEPYIHPSLPPPLYSIGQQIRTVSSEFLVDSFFWTGETWMYDLLGEDGEILSLGEQEITPMLSVLTPTPFPTRAPTTTPVKTPQP